MAAVDGTIEHGRDEKGLFPGPAMVWSVHGQNPVGIKTLEGKLGGYLRWKEAARSKMARVKAFGAKGGPANADEFAAIVAFEAFRKRFAEVIRKPDRNGQRRMPPPKSKAEADHANCGWTTCGNRP